GVGSGFCVFTNINDHEPFLSGSFKLANDCTVFQSECFAILSALNTLQSLPPKSRIVILSDSKSLVDSINNISLSSKTLLKIWYKLRDLKSAYHITLAWIKGHSGVAGNESADSLAKSGANLPPPASSTIPI